MNIYAMSRKTMEILKRCTPIFSILQDENRQEIIMLLFDNKELSVTTITERMALSRPAVSHHLKLLLNVDLVAVRKEGKERYYSLKLNEAVDLLNGLLASIREDSLQQ